MKGDRSVPDLNRRTFLRGMGALAGAATLSGPGALAGLNPDAGKNAAGIPLRVLGRTNEKITILGLGTAPVGQSKPGVAKGVAVYRAALEAGIKYHFEEQILPVARRHGCGILAMKVFGGHCKAPDGYAKRGPSMMSADLLQQAMRYSLGIEGVAGAVIGPYAIEEVEQNAAWARSYAPLSTEKAAALREKGKSLVAAWGPRFGPVA